MNRKVLLPIFVLLFGALGAAGMIASRQTIATSPPEILPPLVRTLEIHPQQIQLIVTAQGTVAPRTESTLIAQVAGEIRTVSPAFADGGFFETGEVLMTIDARDYEVAVSQARVQVAQARLLLSREEAESAIAREEWQTLGSGEPADLVLRKPQIAEVRAALEAARGTLSRAELNLERTRIRAPYAGRVRAKSADVGQYVAPGTALGRIYAVDYAEVRLPIPDDQFAHLDMAFDFRGEKAGQTGPDVRLTAVFAGQNHTWMGRIVRIEGEIDPRSRMVHLIARVPNPYARGDQPLRPPLAVGLFVQAEISGKTVHHVFSIPRAALYSENRVLIVREGRLYFREVKILRTDAHSAIVQSGLAIGERICLSPMDAPVDGMRVRIAEEMAFAPEGGPR